MKYLAGVPTKSGTLMATVPHCTYLELRTNHGALRIRYDEKQRAEIVAFLRDVAKRMKRDIPKDPK